MGKVAGEARGKDELAAELQKHPRVREREFEDPVLTLSFSRIDGLTFKP